MHMWKFLRNTCVLCNIRPPFAKQWDCYTTVVINLMKADRLGNGTEKMIQLCEKSKAKPQQETHKANKTLIQALRPSSLQLEHLDQHRIYLVSFLLKFRLVLFAKLYYFSFTSPSLDAVIENLSLLLHNSPIDLIRLLLVASICVKLAQPCQIYLFKTSILQFVANRLWLFLVVPLHVCEGPDPHQ